MRRRELVSFLGGLVAAWPFAVRAQQKVMPVIGFLSSPSPGPFAPFVAAFHRGLSEIGYVEGQNLVIDYRWAEDHSDRLSALADDFVGRKVDLIASSGSILAALAAKSATSTIPIPSAIRSQQGWLPVYPGPAATSRAAALSNSN